MTTAAARQLLRGRSPFRGEWEHTPCSLFGERMRCAARVKNFSKKKTFFENRPASNITEISGGSRTGSTWSASRGSKEFFFASCWKNPHTKKN
jgi:hypothetical protein